MVMVTNYGFRLSFGGSGLDMLKYNGLVYFLKILIEGIQQSLHVNSP